MGVRPKSRYDDKGDLFCDHCNNREGHEQTTCYQLVGFANGGMIGGNGGEDLEGVVHVVEEVEAASKEVRSHQAGAVEAVYMCVLTM